MTLAELLARLLQSPFVISVTREPDGSVFIECDHGFRDAAWTTIRGITDSDVVDEERIRFVCLELRIPPGAVGL